MKKTNFNQLRNSGLKAALFLAMAFGCISMSYASSVARANTSTQQPAQNTEQTVKGTVVDEKGEPVIGANILVKGVSKGTITNVNGQFTLPVPNLNAVLVISYVGYDTKEVALNGSANVNVTMQENNKQLSEVVVVGYGTQKKVNLTGSVNSIDLTAITDSRPITNIANGLAGAAPGVYIGSAGKPAGGTPTIQIRGQGTLNNSSPLVIIDGVEGGLGSLNPDDIENMSILKDAASAAIYGSRAANGVILITTKKGKSSKIQVSLNSYLSSETVRNTIAPVSDYARYMELINEGYTNVGQPAKFSEASIKEWREAGNSDPLKYPNVDWRKEVFRPSLANTQSLSVSGGSDKVTFFSSFRYSNNPGVIENAGVERYDFRTNLEARPQKWLTLGTSLSGYLQDIEAASDILNEVFTYAQASTPGMVLRSPDGRYGAVNNLEDDAQANNVLHRINARTGDDRVLNGSVRFYGSVMPLKGLSINGSFSYVGNTERQWYKPVFNDRWNFYNNTVSIVGKSRSSINHYSSLSERLFMDGTINYGVKFFDKLNFNAMLGASQEMYSAQSVKASKLDLIDMTLSVPDAAIGDATLTGGKSVWVMQSYFGRLNFNWMEKYLLELNLRADGSSRFRPQNRWGYFPSASFGWRIDQEGFMQNLVNHGLDALKLRVSYGSLGNNSIGNYETLSVYSLSNYVLNHTQQLGLSMKQIANAALTWESTNVANVGLDFTLLKNRMSGSIDVFDKTTENILIDLPAPDVHGVASLPKQNSASVRNRGIEVMLGWQDKIGDFDYFVKGNFSYITNKVLKYKGDINTIVGSALLNEGLPIYTLYLREYDRIVQTPEDLALVQRMIDEAPIDETTGIHKNPFPNGRPELGDILYKDLNGDGVINDDDRRTFGVNGSNYPFLFGVSMGGKYKGFDFSALIQGNAGLKVYYIDGYYSTNVAWGYQINQQIADGRWYEGRSTSALYPRLTNNTTKNILGSNFWLADRSYVKIRNIQLGYTLPKKWSSKIYLSKVRIYGSLENFFTFTSYPGIDPEFTGTSYPSMKQVVAGINVVI